MSEANVGAIGNPYVGPRTFTEEHGELFFGREREARDLVARILSERLTLFYAQSGAGKSSLVNARVVPRLRDREGFEVLPVGRVSGALPQGVDAVDNIYAFNLMASLDRESDPKVLSRLTLKDFLAGLEGDDGDETGRGRRWRYRPQAPEGPADATVGGPRFVLLIDQFEEIVTAHPERWEQRADFFVQLDAAMLGDPNLWVVLIMREDHVAALDPYVPALFNRLQARFSMERMGADAALAAIRGPAEAAGRRFETGAAEQLCDRLRQVRVPGQTGTITGQYVEPVQLQIVCYEFWEKLKDRGSAVITQQDLSDHGNVERALGLYYERVLDDAAQLWPKHSLREWFSEHLITKAKTRGFVLRTELDTEGLPNQVVDRLEQQFLLRRETRAGGVWYELTHDTFIEPIQRSNALQQQTETLPEIVRFTVHPRVISRGVELTLTWDVRNAEMILLNPSFAQVVPERGTLRIGPDAEAYPRSRKEAWTLVAVSGDHAVQAELPDPITVVDDRRYDFQAIAAALAADEAVVLLGSELNPPWLRRASKTSPWRLIGHDDGPWARTHRRELAAMHLRNLRDMAQFYALEERRGLQETVFRAGDTLTELARAVHASDPEAEWWESLNHLAKLPVSVFVTTSPHTLLEQVLLAAGKRPRTLCFPWRETAGSVDPRFDVDADIDPRPDEPLVYHLFGIEDAPDSLMLDEDDYLAILACMLAQPSRGLAALSSALVSRLALMIGFDHSSQEFRTLCHGLFDPGRAEAGADEWRRGTLLQVHWPDEWPTSDLELVKLRLDYRGLDVIWSEPHSFVRRLAAAWASR